VVAGQVGDVCRVHAAKRRVGEGHVMLLSVVVRVQSRASNRYLFTDSARVVFRRILGRGDKHFGCPS
jgi:hypothetical protein